METNEIGQVAIKYKRQNQKLVNGYVFIVRANISMAWINPEDVQKLLNIRGGCCGAKQKMFLPSNPDDVRRWTQGGGR